MIERQMWPSTFVPRDIREKVARGREAGLRWVRAVEHPARELCGGGVEKPRVGHLPSQVPEGETASDLGHPLSVRGLQAGDLGHSPDSQTEPSISSLQTLQSVSTMSGHSTIELFALGAKDRFQRTAPRPDRSAHQTPLLQPMFFAEPRLQADRAQRAELFAY